MFPDHPLAKTIEKLQVTTAAATAAVERDFDEDMVMATTAQGSDNEAAARPQTARVTNTNVNVPNLLDALDNALQQRTAQQTRELEEQRQRETRRLEREAAGLREELAHAKEREEENIRKLELQQRAARLQQLEAAYKSHEADLMQYYNRQMSIGNTLLVSKNYQLAIHEYNAAIPTINSLKSHYEKHVRETQGIFYTIDSNKYKHLEDSVRLAIANVYYQNKQILEAYKALLVLNLDERNSQHITAIILFNACKDEIITTANQLVRDSVVLDVKSSPTERAKARELLNQAKAKFDLVKATYSLEYLQQSHRIAWFDSRVELEGRALRALATKLPLTDYSNLDYDLRQIIARYTDNHEFLTAEESDRFNELQSFHSHIAAELQQQLERERLERERVADIQAQKAIHGCIKDAYACVMYGDIITALEKLQSARKLATHVYNPDNINTYKPMPGEHELRYTPANFFDESIEILKAEQINFIKRRDTAVAIVVDRIIATTLQDISSTKTVNTTTFVAKILEPHQAKLEVALVAALKDDWHKFDRRASVITTALKEFLQEQLTKELVDIGIFTKYWHWTYATLQFIDPSQSCIRLTNAVRDYEIASQADHIVNLPIYAQVVTPPEPEQSQQSRNDDVPFAVVVGEPVAGAAFEKLRN